MEHTTAAATAFPRVWSVTDGHAGNARQADALAAALAMGGTESHTIHTRAPWRWFAPRRLPASARAFGAGFGDALAQAPDIAIGCGRQAALATRVLRAHGAQAIQILDPRIDTRRWDWVIAPAHDDLRGDNVITVQGSLNPIDDDWLADARTRFASLAALPAPRTAVLLGGSSAHFQFDAALLESVITALDATIAREGGSLMITASRRTDAALRERLRQHYADRAALLWLDERDGGNPYAGLLTWADRIVCSADSVNMISEACATRVPVFVFAPERLRGRPQSFLAGLLAQGRVQAFALDASAGFHSPAGMAPLRETARVAALLRDHWRQTGTFPANLTAHRQGLP